MIYGKLARVYDAISDFDHVRYVDFIAPLLSGKGLDLACGSGAATRLLRDKGFEMTGVDASAEMLSLALSRDPDIKWIEADISRLKLPAGEYGFITCVCDGFNYLSPRAFERTLARAFDALKEGGTLVFDLSSRYKLQSMLPGDWFYEDEGIYLGWNNFFSRGALDVFLTIFLPCGGGLFEKTEEEHRLYVHDDERIRAALKGAETIVLDAETFRRASGRSLRKLYICKKVKA